jgi:hypothetical protein
MALPIWGRKGNSPLGGVRLTGGFRRQGKGGSCGLACSLLVRGNGPAELGQRRCVYRAEGSRPQGLGCELDQAGKRRKGQVGWTGPRLRFAGFVLSWVGPG